MGKIKLLNLADELEYLKKFKEEFIDIPLYTHDKVIVIVNEGNFHHIFYRNKGMPTKYFDKRLANRMLYIKAIIELKYSHIEVYENTNTKNWRLERSYLYIHEKICVFLLRDIKNKCFYLITAYRKNNNELQKLRGSKYMKRIV